MEIFSKYILFVYLYIHNKSKISFCLHACTVYIYYVLINTHTHIFKYIQMEIFSKYILFVCIYIYIYIYIYIIYIYIYIYIYIIYIYVCIRIHTLCKQKFL